MIGPSDLVLVDLTFLLEASAKSFYGAPLILGSQGEDNTVLYGLARDLLRLRKRIGIRHTILILGREGNTVSSEADVKGVMSFLRRLRIAVVHEPDVTAASLCGCFAPVARWVVTQNKVLFQLTSNAFGVIVPDAVNSELEVVTLESFKVRFGIRPSQISSFLALTEDGNKSLFTKRQAIRLLEVHDDLGKILQDISAVSSHSMRRQLSASKTVLTGRLRQMGLAKAVCQPAALAGLDTAFIRDDEGSAEVLRDYGFWSLVHLLPLSMTIGARVSAKVKHEAAYKAVRDEAGMRELEALVSKSEVCAMDTEASDKDPRSASLFGVAFSVTPGEAYYVPMTKADLDRASADGMRARLRKLFAGRTRFIGHNLKFDCVLLRKHGITIKHAFFDTMLAAYECFGDWEFFNLGFLAKKLLGQDIKKYKDIVGKGETLLDVPFSELLEHACADADMTLRLYYRLQEELAKRELREQFSSDAMALLRVLADKECKGVRLNIRAIFRRKQALADEADALRKAAIAQAGKEFNLDSPTETAMALRGISPFGERAGQRLTLSRLEELAGTHDLPRLIVRYSRVQKLVRQLEAICTAVKGGRVFPIFSQVRWAHGGLSSSPRICEPDIPLDATTVIDDAIRERMNDWNRSLDTLQRMSDDSVLKRDLRTGGDYFCLFRRNAALRHVDQRDLLLSVAIGLSNAALSRRFLIDRVTAAGIRQALEAKYVKVFKWLDTYRTDTMTRGFGFHDGRRKYLDGLKSSDIDKRQNALVSAVRWAVRY
jgi:DNA polymerase I-like protein with 3'-5' exonuclease and polymerase domains